MSLSPPPVVPPSGSDDDDDDDDDLFGFGSGAAKVHSRTTDLEDFLSGNARGAPKTLLSLPPEELVELLGGSGRAKMAWNALREGLDPSLTLTTTETPQPQPQQLGKAVRSVVGEHLSSLPPMVHSVASADGTRKMLLRLRDGLEVECVLIPMTGGAEHRAREAQRMNYNNGQATEEEEDEEEEDDDEEEEKEGGGETGK